jgi:hypothetical protein
MYLPKITNEIIEDFYATETPLIIFNSSTQEYEWTQLAVDFVGVLGNSKENIND